MNRELLERVVDWYRKDSSAGGLAALIGDIEAELTKPESTAQKPLSNDEIIMIAADYPLICDLHFIKAARAIEKAHGIVAPRLAQQNK